MNNDQGQVTTQKHSEAEITQATDTQVMAALEPTQADRLSHDGAIKALCDCAATVTVLSYQEAIEGYFALRGIPVPKGDVDWSISLSQPTTIGVGENLASSSPAEPVAYFHTLHMEGGQTYDKLLAWNGVDENEPQRTAFGMPGRDYSDSYTVTTTPLYVAPVPPPAGEADEAYEIGKRDGYEAAIADIDRRTGGDGEYFASTIPGRGCPDWQTMMANIVERFESATPAAGDADLCGQCGEYTHDCNGHPTPVAGDAALRKAAQAILDNANRPGSRMCFGGGPDGRDIWIDHKEVDQSALDALEAALATPPSVPVQQGEGAVSAFILHVAEAAHAMGWQAGVGGMETAGAIISYLATHPDKLEAFMERGIFGWDAPDWIEGGCLTWHAMNGKIVHPSEARAARAESATPPAQDQTTSEAAPAVAADPERCDYEISDDGVMTATADWVRDDQACALRLLACHSIDAPRELVATWTDEQVKQADIWAWSCALSASDNDDIQVPPRPDFLPDATDHWAGRNPITGEPV